MKRPDLDDITDVVAKGEQLRQDRADLRKKNADCALVVTPHPMTVQGQRVLDAQAAALVPGETLASFLARHGVVPGQQWVVSLGGVPVPEKHWGRVKPKHGHLIEARRVPQNDVLRIVAIAVIAYYTFGAGGAAGGSFLGFTGAAAYAAAAVAFYAGASLVNRLLGPKPPDLMSPSGMSSSPTYSLTGGRNRIRQFEPMGLVLGQPYCVPDLAAYPYTYFANGEQYLWQLFHAGINCASVDTLRIGQTAVSSYQNVVLSYEGFAAGNTGLALLSNVDTIAGALLDAPTAPGPWVTRTSSPNTVELVADMEGSVFSLNQGSGAYQSLTCLVEMEYRAVGAPSWEVFYVTPPYTVVVGPHTEYDAEGQAQVVPGYSYTYTPSYIEITNASTRPVRQTYRRQVPAGQYEVRARKVSANVAASNQQNTLQWTTLKSYQLDNGNYKGQARLGMQIQATGQLNGSLDEVNWMGTAKPMPYWNGSAWVTATTRENGLSNPGALILLLARGIYDEDNRLLAGLGWDDAQIDIDSLKLFMVWCAAKSFKFDYFLQETMSIGDLLKAIAAAGMGDISFHTGKLGVIWFADDQPVESVLNMATTKVRSFSVDYVTMATADELEIQYFDRDRGNTWKSVRVLAPGVTVPTATARRPLQGVTSEAHAAMLARFAMGQNVYQRKSVGCEVDLEHLTFRRGTVLALSHDLTQWGYGGRVQAAVNSAGTVTLTLDDLVPAVSPSGATSRYIGLRLAGENQYRVFPMQDFSGSTRSITLGTAWPDGVPVPGDSADNPPWDCLWIYDFKSTPGQRLRVVEISPNGNMGGAKVVMTPESQEFWSYVWSGAYTPPPNTSLLQGAPVVEDVTVTEQLGRQGNTYYTELTVSFNVTGRYNRAELWGAVDGGVMQLLDRSDNTRMNWRGGMDEVWLLQIQAFSDLRMASYTLEYEVKGLRVPPPNVTSFAIDGNRFIWDEVVGVPDLAGFQIRFNYGNAAWWDTAQPLHKGLLTASPYEPPQLPSGAVFLIKAFDTSGNPSAAAAVVIGPATAPAVRNVLYSWPQAPGFTGSITGGAVSAGVLQATATDLFYGSPLAPFYGAALDPFYATSTAMELVYEFEALAIEAGRLLLQYTLAASNFIIEYRRGNSAPFYGAPNDYFYGAPADPFYDLPQSWAIWPGYLDLAGPGVVRFRFTLEAGPVRGEIFTLTALLDVADIVIKLNDVPISPGGTRLALGQTVHGVKSVHLTLQEDGGTGATPLASEKNSPLGPLALVLDVAQVSVSGLVDADITAF